MTAAHVHLLLNHIPILGSIFGLLVLSYGMLRKSDEIKKTSLGVFVITALVTIPVYLTGDGAAKIVSSLPGVSTAIIQQHDQAATITMFAIQILGALSLLSLWLSWRSRRELRSWMTLGVFILAMISSGLGAWTGSIGGQIRHTEVRVGFTE
jgi:formate hydrogenlyase subunit 3/multisubunit Na+/H+ antiporter MnhD subunit